MAGVTPRALPAKGPELNANGLGGNLGGRYALTDLFTLPVPVGGRSPIQRTAEPPRCSGWAERTPGSRGGER